MGSERNQSGGRYSLQLHEPDTPFDPQADWEKMDRQTVDPTYSIRLALMMGIVALICAVMVFAAYSEAWTKYTASLGDHLHWL